LCDRAPARYFLLPAAVSFDEFKAAVKSEPTLAAYLLTPLKRAASGHFAVPAATATA